MEAPPSEQTGASPLADVGADYAAITLTVEGTPLEKIIRKAEENYKSPDAYGDILDKKSANKTAFTPDEEKVLRIIETFTYEEIEADDQSGARVIAV